MALCDFSYHRPRSVAEASDLARSLGTDAAFLAGGTELLPDFKRDRDSKSHLISLKDVAELAEIREDGGELRIGSMVRLDAIASSPLVRSAFPVLAEAASWIGGVQIRHQGTIGGNYCRAVPCADTPPACIAGETRLRLLSNDGERTVPAGEFFVGPRLTILDHGEILESVIVPPQPPSSGMSYQRFSLRKGAGLSVASAAARVVLDGDAVREARIVLGAVAPVPLLAKKASAALAGKTAGTDAFAEAARIAATEAEPITDLRGSDRFRRDLVETLTLRALEEATARAGSERA